MKHKDDDEGDFNIEDFKHEPAYWTRDEKKRVMSMVQQHEHARWLWNTIMVWCKWFSVVGAGVTALKLGFYDTIKAWVASK